MKARETIDRLKFFIIERLEEGYYDFEVKFHVGNCRYLAIVSGNNVFIGSFDKDEMNYPRIEKSIEDKIKSYVPSVISALGFTSFKL